MKRLNFLIGGYYIIFTFILLCFPNLLNAQSCRLKETIETGIGSDAISLNNLESIYFDDDVFIHVSIHAQSPYNIIDTVYITLNRRKVGTFQFKVHISDLSHKLKGGSIQCVSFNGDELVVGFENCIGVFKYTDNDFTYYSLIPTQFSYIQIERLGESFLLINNYNFHPLSSVIRSQITVFEPEDGLFPYSNIFEFRGIEWTHLINKFITTNNNNRIFVADLFDYGVIVYNQKLEVVDTIKNEIEGWQLVDNARYQVFHDSLELLRKTAPLNINAKNIIREVYEMDKEISRIQRLEAFDNKLLVVYRLNGAEKNERYINIWVSNKLGHYELKTELMVNTILSEYDDVLTMQTYPLFVCSSYPIYYNGKEVNIMVDSQENWLNLRFDERKRRRDGFFLENSAIITRYIYALD